MSLPWSLHWFNGILLLTASKAVSFDPVTPSTDVDVVLISHAHGDHVAGFRSPRPKITTAPTLELYEARHARKVQHVLPVFFDSQRTRLEEVTVETYDAGHILGSSQFLFTSHDNNIAYTGDLNREKTVVTEPAATLECDELIVDATFGHPDVKFPPRQESYTEIVHWSWEMLSEGRIPVFFAYEIGKAQELVRLFNEYSGVDVVVEDSIHRMCTVYERYGITLRCTSRASEEGQELLKRRDCILVVPTRTSLHTARQYGDIATAVTTGWSLLYNYRAYDRAFPLSSHCDFDHLLMFTKESRARRVYPFGSHAKEFAYWLNKKSGIGATPLYQRRDTDK